MGKLYTETEKYLGNVKDTVFLEIGSDRYEGSTIYFANLARRLGAEFHTVDIVEKYKKPFEGLSINWHTAAGSAWCTNELPKINKPVSCVYLDNYDYNWNVLDKTNKMINKQIDFYRDNLNIDMNNTDCQIEHLKQAMAIFKYLTKDATVVCDDTYLWNDCWVGKCGAAVTWLLCNNYVIAEHRENVVFLKPAGVWKNI